MFTDDEAAYLRKLALTLQIVVGALAMSVFMFAAIVTTILPPPAAMPGGQPLITYAAAAFGFAAVGMALILPGVIQRNYRRAIVEGKPLTTNIAAQIPAPLREIGQLGLAYQTVLIIRSALLEGAAFFALIAYMLERQTLSLVVAGGLLLILLSGFPTRSKLREAIESERRVIKELQQLGATDAR
jgi:hypothetical protein